jgi:hypothetical protein
MPKPPRCCPGGKPGPIPGPLRNIGFTIVGSIVGSCAAYAILDGGRCRQAEMLCNNKVGYASRQLALVARREVVSIAIVRTRDNAVCRALGKWLEVTLPGIEDR